jgi:hypothetical protein
LGIDVVKRDHLNRLEAVGAFDLARDLATAFAFSWKPLKCSRWYLPGHNAWPHTAKMSRDYIGLNRMKPAPHLPIR